MTKSKPAKDPRWLRELHPEIRAEIAATKDIRWLRGRLAEVKAEAAKIEAQAANAATAAELAKVAGADTKVGEDRAVAEAVKALKAANTAAEAARLAKQRELIDVVDGVFQVLLHLGLNRQELLPLDRLMWALMDHARGKEHPLIAVNRRPGQRAHTVDQMLKCYAAALVETLIRAGDKKKDARKKTVEVLRAAGLKISDANLTTWHHELSNARADDMTLYLYEYLAATFFPQHPAPSDRENWIRETLDRARRFFSATLREEL